MAYGFASLGSSETTDAALDKPLVGANVIPKVPTTEKWNHEGTTAADGHPVAGYPIHRAHDADPGLITKPDSSLNTWHIVYNLGTTVDVDFGSVGPGHNLGSLALTGLSLDFDQNQDGAFTAVDTCDLVGSFPTSSNDRIMQLELQQYKAITAYADAGGGRVTVTSTAHGLPSGSEVIITGSTNYNDTFTIGNVAANTFEITHSWDGNDAAGQWQISTPQRFSDVQYCRLRMAKGAGIVPQISEFIAGARWQSPRWPNKPFNKDNLHDIAETSGPTKGGSTDKTIFAENQFRMSGVEWSLSTSETAAVRSWWKKTRGSFLWVWEPSSAPEAFNLMVRDEDSLVLPRSGWQEQTFRLSGIEQGPESEYLENE